MNPQTDETVYFSPIAKRWIGAREFRITHDRRGYTIAIVRRGEIYDYQAVGLSYPSLKKEVEWLESTGMRLEGPNNGLDND